MDTNSAAQLTLQEAGSVSPRDMVQLPSVQQATVLRMARSWNVSAEQALSVAAAATGRGVTTLPKPRAPMHVCSAISAASTRIAARVAGAD